MTEVRVLTRGQTQTRLCRPGRNSLLNRGDGGLKDTHGLPMISSNRQVAEALAAIEDKTLTPVLTMKTVSPGLLMQHPCRLAFDRL